MANRLKIKRSTVAGRVPGVDIPSAGELYLNMADRQLGYFNVNGGANELLGVRVWTEFSDYKLDDIVTYVGNLYVCIVAHTAVPFNTTNWSPIYSPIGTGTQFSFEWSTALADPGVGACGCNNADPTLATEFNISNQTEFGSNIQFFLGTVTEGEYFAFEETAGNRESVFFWITGPPVDNGGWWTFPAQYVGGAGNPEDGRSGIVSHIQDPANKLPAGGDIGQHLAKVSTADYDTEWVDPATGVVWTDISIDTPAVAGVGYNVDTTLAAVLLTMPAVPLAGDVIKFVSAKGTFGTFPLTIGHNAIPIMGLLEDMTVNEAFGAATLEYINATDGWVITDGKK